ncbi:MAG: DUF3168 domain-containing protein [Fimbriimonadaceae bacterium]|nr:DUF3168 domain-containing protein [Alphaproteobacteria bacterium]
MNAQSALQKGVFETLTASVALTGLLGGAHVYDHVPRQTMFPYVTLGTVICGDWSTGTEAGDEHFMTVHVWSRAGGYKEAQDIVGAVGDALHDAAIGLTGHTLINLRFQSSEIRRERDGETLHGIMRYRAVTEPVN